jgi:hypothetical protein
MKTRRALKTLFIPCTWSPINRLEGFLLVTSLTATLTLTAAAQTNNLQDAAAQTPSFQALGQMPGAARGFGTFAVNISNDGSTIARLLRNGIRLSF